MSHDLFHVSCKAIIFNNDKSKVLIARYSPSYTHRQYGLFGGHMNTGEQIEDALRRELKEELHLDVAGLKPAGFSLHFSGKIILAFETCIDENQQLEPDRVEVAGAQWVGIDELRGDRDAYDLHIYRDLILSCVDD